MRILVCPDKFKGTLSATAAATAIRAGLLRQLPDAQIILRPLADGGEGSLEVLRSTGAYRVRRLSVTGPLRRPVAASYLTDGDRAYIESAMACGLRHVPVPRRNPGYTTTIGVGELIEDAVVRGARHVTLFLGGSATNDAGAGMAGVLGYRFFSDRPGDFIPTGDSLRYVRRIDRQGVLPALANVRFVAACDVNNPLLGDRGATHAYAQQKGASPDQLPELEANMAQFADRLETALNVRTHDRPFTGAAGGLAAGALAFLGAELRPGTELLFEALDLRRELERADLVVTGEGSLDRQTLAGKVVAAVAARARCPVVVLCGRNALTTAEQHAAGLGAVHALTDQPGVTDERARLEAAELLTELAASVLLPSG